eukprot:scaffold147905_cov22-Tisochrysis_lutea.AAC.1
MAQAKGAMSLWLFFVLTLAASLAQYARPVFVVVENIPEVWQREGGVYVQFCMASLLNLRYQMRSGIIEAGGCGVPQ